MNNNLRDPFNLRRNLLASNNYSNNNNNRGAAPNAAAALTQLSLLRVAASQVATQVSEKVTETASEAIERGRQAVEDLNNNLREQQVGKAKKSDEDMSFTVPKNVPSFNNPQRALEDHLWGSSGVTARAPGHRAGLGGGGIIGEGLGKVDGFLHPNRNMLPMYKDKPFAYPPSQRNRPIYRRKSCMAIALFLVVLVAYWFGIFGDEPYERIPSLKTSGWLQAEEAKAAKGKVDWLERRQRVVEAFELSWDAYERYAWGKHHPPHLHLKAEAMLWLD